MSDSPSPTVVPGPFQLLETLGGASPLAVIATDIAGIVHVWSPEAERIYGWLRSETIGKAIYTLTVGPLDQDISEQIMHNVASGKTWQGHFHARTKTGDIVRVNVANFPIRQGNDIIGVAGISMTSDRGTDNLAGFDAASSSGLRDLAREIRDVRRRERAQLAMFLHDDIGQILSMVRTEVLGAMELPQGAEASLTHALRHLDLANSRVRQEVGDLLLKEIDVWELLLQLEEILAAMQQRFGILTRLTVHVAIEDLRSVRPKCASTALAITKEALRNCERHSGATTVDVSVTIEGLTLVVEVTDNGRGITETPSGSGSVLMRTRATAVGGTLTIEPRADSARTGTHVVARLPVGGGGN